jgi:hypothetical protein
MEFEERQLREMLKSLDGETVIGAMLKGIDEGEDITFHFYDSFVRVRTREAVLSVLRKRFGWIGHPSKYDALVR